MSALTVGHIRNALANVPDDYVVCRGGPRPPGEPVAYQLSHLDSMPVGKGVRSHEWEGRVRLDSPRLPPPMSGNWDSVDTLLTASLLHIGERAWPHIVAAHLAGDTARETTLLRNLEWRTLESIRYYTSVHPEWEQAMERHVPDTENADG